MNLIIKLKKSHEKLKFFKNDIFSDLKLVFVIDKCEYLWKSKVSSFPSVANLLNCPKGRN